MAAAHLVIEAPQAQSYERLSLITLALIRTARTMKRTRQLTYAAASGAIRGMDTAAEQAKRQWDATPCGAFDSESGASDYFTEVERLRFEEYARWMKPCFAYDQHRGQRVLEVGFGQGTDLVQFAKGGAGCYGVDLSERHLELASKNFECRNLRANLFLEDVRNLHFPDAFFDAVYSFGVLHHSDEPERCFSEIRRVLKPGGEFKVALYHRNSVYFWHKLLVACNR